MNNRNLTSILIILLVGLALFASQGVTLPAAAQNLVDAWSDPVNISRSGGARFPSMVQDNTGIVHVFWKDDVRGYTYSGGEGNTWSPASAPEFPFDLAETTPQFYTDNLGFIHALWIGDNNTLQYSRALAANLGSGGSFTAAQILAESALDFSLSVADDNRLHLAYVRKEESDLFPSGIYYRTSGDAGDSWSQSANLYASRYLRAIDDAEANVEIASASSAAGQSVYIVWDDRPLKRVFVAVSPDGGDSWGAPVEVFGPSEQTSDTPPFNIRLSANQDQVMLVWQVGQLGFNCAQYSSQSLDRGATWSPDLRMLQSLAGCAIENVLLGEVESGDQSYTLLVSNFFEKYYLSAWNGETWSLPELQPEIDNFIDPVNFVQIDNTDQRFQLRGDTLLMVGYDRSSARDIWFASRQVGAFEDWFPALGGWAKPRNLALLEYGLSDPVMLTDSQNNIHAFWLQAINASQVANLPNPSAQNEIYYTRWSAADGWLQPAAVLQAPGNHIREFSVTIDQFDRIYAAFTGTDDYLYYSWTDANEAASPNQWSEALPITTPTSKVSSPDIVVDNFATLHIAFAVPINAQHGIYVMRSTDQGASWTEADLVFDAASLNFESVDQPEFIITESGNYHLIFERVRRLSGQGSSGLYYTASFDFGQTWSDLQVVSENPILWSDFVLRGEREIHRFWQQLDGESLALVHEYSLDEGLTWIQTTGVSTSGTLVGPVDVYLDAAGQISFFQLISHPEARLELQHWRWDGLTWQPGDFANVLIDPLDDGYAMAAAVNAQGMVMAIYATAVEATEESPYPVAVNFLSSQISMPEIIVNQPGSTPTPQSVATAPATTPTALPVSPTATPDLASLSANDTQAGILSNTYAGAIIGGFMSLVVVVLAVVLFQRSKRPRLSR